MSGSTVQQLSLYTSHEEGTTTVVREIFVQNYDMGPEWRHYSRSFDLSAFNYVLTIEGITLATNSSDLALANFTVVPYRCETDLGQY